MKTSRPLGRIAAVLAAAWTLAGTPAFAAGVTVNDSSDVLHNMLATDCANDGTGTCSLRDAITWLNGQGAGPHTITFSGVSSIALTTGGLPTITVSGVTIDGTTGSMGRVEITGTSLMGSNVGMKVSGANCLLKALVVNAFGADGIDIQPQASGCVIQDCYVGTDVTGATDAGNAANGININAPGVTLLNNVISGNGGDGLTIFGTTTLLTTLTNNKIGTDVTGQIDIGNDDSGIRIYSGADQTNIAGGNVISGNGKHGIWFQGSVGVMLNVVSGNFIGTNLTGTLEIANDEDGVHLDDVTFSTIGPGNIISGNGQHGVVLSGSSCENNIVQGNIVGLQVGGILGAGNDGDGILLDNARNNLVGGPLLPDPSLIRNIVGSNGGAGIRIKGSGNTFGNDVKGNYVGTDLFGLLSLPNAVGIVVESSSVSDIDIGGTTDEEANVVANNTGPGIQIGANVNDGPGPVLILRNKVYGNGGLGIDLDNDGVTPNDPGDGDIGSNELQNYPAITLALVSTTNGQIVIEGTQDSRPGQATQLQFFRAELDPSGFGEGKELLLDVPNAGVGNFSFGTSPSSPPVAVSPGDALTITATTVADGTSEFSANATFVANQKPIASAGPNQTVGVGSLVTLDGSASSDPDGQPDSAVIQNGRFTWAQTMGPAVVLGNPTSPNPSFTAVTPGTYVFSLVVNDGLDDSTNLANVTITVSAFGTLQFSAAAYPTNEGAGTATLTVTRTGGSFGAVSVDYAVTGGTATLNSDFMLAAGTLNWTDGDASDKTIVVTLIDDPVPAEPNETVDVALSNALGGAAVGAPAQATLTIVDNDIPGSLQFASAASVVSEAAGTATLTVTRIGGSFGAVSVDYAVTGGTATSGSDFVLAAGTLNWTDGDLASKSITVTNIDDSTPAEPNETVEVTLSNPGGGASVGAPALTTLTVVDDDVPGTLQFALAAYTTNEGDGMAVLTVTRTGGNDGNVSVDYSVTGGTAGGGDFTLASGTLNWPNGDATPKTIAVTVIDDPVAGEPNETVVVTLGNPAGGATVGAPADTTLTIVDNDVPQPGSLQFSAPGYSTNEGAGTATLTVDRTGGSDGAVSADYMVTGGTAGGGDFTLANGTLNWVDGDSAPKSITVTVIDDPTAGEPDETVLVTLSNPGGGAAVGVPATTTLTIVDNDPTGTLQFDAAAYSAGESGATATVTVTRVGGSSGMVTVDYATSDGAATLAGNDYASASGTLTWTNGDSAPKTFDVTVNDDPTIEGDETVNLTLSNPGGGATLGAPSAAVLTIVDDDGTAADLAIAKTDGRTSVTPGRKVAYTITVGNPGPVALTGATVTDTPPAALLAVTWTCIPSAGAACAPSGSGAINDSVNLPLASSVTYTLLATVDPAASGSLVNTATVALPPGFGDLTPADNTSTDADAIVPPGVKDDFDADGRSDLILYNTATGQVDIWLMNGIAVGNAGTAGAMADLNWQIVGTGDNDGDGRADILWHNAATGEALVWLMNGTMMAGQAVVGGFPDLDWKVGASGDFDADGKFDVAWRNNASGEVYLWLMDGLTIASQGSVGTSAAPVIAAGDYDGDGLWDLLFRPTSGGAGAIWFLNGLTLVSQSPTSLSLTDPNFQAIGYGDHNGDGRADVLWHNMITGGKVIWLMNGASAQSGPPGGTLRAHPEAVGTGDYDGDGRADIAWQNRSTARVFAWLMNGLVVTSQGLTGLFPGPGTVWKVVRMK